MKGRPRKAGKRNAKGRLIATASFDRGTERVQQMQRLYGTFYASAAGRMFASGLMGAQEDALGRYQGLQRFTRLYKRIYGGPAYRCPLDQTPRGEDHEAIDHEQAERDRQWMRHAMHSLDASGCYVYLEQLISVNNVDHGPAWLDRLIDVQQWNNNLDNLNRQLRAKGAAGTLTRKEPDPRDQMIADAAIAALDILAPATRKGVVVERWEVAA